MEKLRAKFLCHVYLLCWGMWRGECEFRAENTEGELTLIASGTGSMSRGDVRLSRIFYNPTGKTQSDVTAALNGWEWARRP